MTDRRSNGNGNGNGNGRYTDPTENVKELVDLQALRQDEARIALAERLDERDRMREIHRLELAAKDALIAQKESERINAVAAVEKAATAAQFAEQKGALALASTAADLKASALAKEQGATAGALATTTAANLARSGLSTPLLLTLATFGGGIVVFLIQQMLRTTP